MSMLDAVTRSARYAPQTRSLRAGRVGAVGPFWPLIVRHRAES